MGQGNLIPDWELHLKWRPRHANIGYRLEPGPFIQEGYSGIHADPEWFPYLGQACEVMPRRKMFSLGVYTIVFQAEVFAILACVNYCTESNDPLRHHG
jgi:hypothetical protein